MEYYETLLTPEEQIYYNEKLILRRNMEKYAENIIYKHNCRCSEMTIKQKVKETYKLFVHYSDCFFENYCISSIIFKFLTLLEEDIYKISAEDIYNILEM